MATKSSSSSRSSSSSKTSSSSKGSSSSSSSSKKVYTSPDGTKTKTTSQSKADSLAAKKTTEKTSSSKGGSTSTREQYQYVDRGGKLKTVNSQAEADSAADRDPKSGTMRIQGLYSDGKDNGITASSGNARDEEKKLGSDITKLSAPAYSAPAKNTKYLDDYEKTLGQIEREAARSINNTYDGERTTTKEEQINETGANSASLARIGGYLGNSASGTGSMLKLSASHRAELASLESKRQGALSESRIAFAEKRFQVAKAKADEARYWESETYKRQQDFFGNQLDVLQEDRAQDSHENTKENQKRDDSRAVITNIITNSNGKGWDQLDKETQDMITSNATTAGYPLGVIKNMLDKPKAEAARVDQLVKDAARYGAPASILSAISGAGTFTEAATIAAPYLAKSTPAGRGGSGGGGSSGSDSDTYSTSSVPIPSFDQFVVEYLQTPAGQERKKQIEEQRRMNMTPEAMLNIFKNDPTVKSVYDSTAAKVKSSGSGSSGAKYSRDQILKLEAAGLMGASREEQLKHLYPPKSGGSGVDSRIDEME
jgi:hypothetical protein